MKVLFFIMVIFVNLFPTAGFAAEVADLYRQRNCDQIITLLKELHPQQHNEESLYFLALCYVKKKDYEKAKEHLVSLLNLDPVYYVYRINYDLDIAPILDWTDLGSLLQNYKRGSIVAKRPLVGHEIVQTESGLYLLRNGLKTILTTEAKVRDIGFVNDDTVYYVLPTKQKGNVLYIYSASDKRMIFTVPVKGSFNQITSNISGNKVLVQTSDGFQLFHQDTWRSVIPYTEGQFIQDDPAKRIIKYSIYNSKTKMSESMTIGY